jgi:HD-like signal output (HDOD) protein
MQQALKKAGELLTQVKVPSLPQEVIQIQEELNKRYPNTVTVANLIAHHPELLNSLLDLVNSSITHIDEPIHDARSAVNLLGLDELYNIFLASVFCERIAQNDEEREILQHGAMAGIAAAELSYWVEGITRSEAYLAGLTQNVGAIYMARLDKAYMHFFRDQLSKPWTAYEAELKHYGTAHTFVGTLVAKKWHIDADIYKAILLHHDRHFTTKTVGHNKARKLIALILVANYVVSVTLGEHFITSELKAYRDAGMEVITLPDIAISAASAAVMKWGKSATLVSASH